mgnify:CR=1 FL=1
MSLLLHFSDPSQAMENVDEAAAMLHEMSTVGVSMAVLVTVVWGIMVMVSKTMEKGVEKNNISKADIRSK